MRISKLTVIAVLTGTLGLVGCGDDASTTPDGGGGSAGTGGAGGGGMLEACGAGESLDESFATDEGMATCDGLGVLDVPIILVLAAKPAGDIDGTVDFEVQAQFILDEPTVAAIGNLVQDATVREVSAEVADAQGNDSINVPATVPCTVDFTEDTDDNGMPGPVVVATPVVAGAWTAVDGSIVLEAAELTFDIAAPPLSLSTMGEDPTCIWDSIPTITFPPVAQ
ncbi:MAG: hypothetical protein WBB42_12920 [Polyangiales bacterium]